MPFQIHEHNGILRCEGDLDIRSVEELRSVLCEHLEAKPGLALDLSAVATCDTAGLQLLYSARKQAAGSGKQLEIHEPSSAIRSTAAILGIRLEDLGPGASGV